MKNIKSFNKKGASKSSAKKDDEPPPPKVRAKIYSSSDDENDDDADEDDEDEADIKEEDDEERMEDELGDDEMPKTDDPEDAFLNGWTKADVKHLLSKIQFEIPKNDNIKASTRVKQLNWENIKFNSYTAAQCLEKWKTIEKKIRGYRILQELLTDAQQWLEQPWTDFYKGNKKKYMRHPEMPKKPLTSYMIFYLKKKDSIAKEFPLLTLTDLSKVIAERFNKLAPNKKAKYNEMALQMKEDYQAKMKKFAVEHPAEMTRMYNNGGRRTRATQNAMPGWSGGNKPLPPVRLFIEDKMKVHTGDLDANLPELQAQYKEKWKSMTAKKKLPWIRWAYDSELKYIEELKAYQARNPHFDVPKYKSVLLKEERSLLEKMQGKPDKPPPSAYLLFSSVMLRDPNLQKLTPKERMQETARLWKNVPKVEKEGYQEKVKHLANVYKLEYASYLESLPEDKRKEELANNMPKRRAKSSSSNSAKKLKTEIKSSDEKPRLPLEELVKKQPVPPPKDAYALFCQDYKDYPEKEIRKSWDALLEAPRNKLEARVEKLKQQYILDMRKFLKSLDPEDLQIYSAYKAGMDHQSPDVNLSESEGSDEEEEEEEEESEDEEVSEEEQKVDISAVKLESPKKSVSNIKTEPIKKEESSSSDEEEEEGKTAGKSSSSSSSSESSSEEGSSSTSGSSSSSEDEDAGAF
uniref:HMG box domain-containing protein n=1 Tax=Lygus hesperus TaxID=30085 RepID=A0A0K8TIC1_LYGHE